MKKSVGTKMYLMIGLLVALFLGYSVLSILGLNEAKRSIGGLHQTYMQLQAQNEVVSKTVPEIRLYSNLMIMNPDKTVAAQMAPLIPGMVGQIDAALATMEELTLATGNQELIVSLKAYSDGTHKLEENIMTTTEAVLANDFAAAAASNGLMRDIVMDLQTKQTAFTELLVASANASAEYGLKAVGFIELVAIGLNVAIIVVEALLIVLIIFTVCGFIVFSSFLISSICTPLQTVFL